MHEEPAIIRTDADTEWTTKGEPTIRQLFVEIGQQIVPKDLQQTFNDKINKLVEQVEKAIALAGPENIVPARLVRKRLEEWIREIEIERDYDRYRLLIRRLQLQPEKRNFFTSPQKVTGQTTRQKFKDFERKGLDLGKRVKMTRGKETIEGTITQISPDLRLKVTTEDRSFKWCTPYYVETI